MNATRIGAVVAVLLFPLEASAAPVGTSEVVLEVDAPAWAVAPKPRYQERWGSPATREYWEHQRRHGRRMRDWGSVLTVAGLGVAGVGGGLALSWLAEGGGGTGSGGIVLLGGMGVAVGVPMVAVGVPLWTRGRRLVLEAKPKLGLRDGEVGIVLAARW